MTFPHPETDLQPGESVVPTFNPNRVFSLWCFFAGRIVRGWALVSISTDAGFLHGEARRRGGACVVMFHESKAEVDSLSFIGVFDKPQGFGRSMG